MTGPHAAGIQSDGLPDDLPRDNLAAFIAAEMDVAVRQSSPLMIVEWPDVVERNDKAVDFHGRDSDGDLYVEHTQIESYPDQKREMKAIAHYFPLGGPHLPGMRDAANFSLGVRAGDLASVPRKERPPIGEKITEWVAEHISEVRWPRSEAFLTSPRRPGW